MDLTKEETDIVIAAIRQHLPKDVEVYFFGSRVDGTSHKGSDLDVLIKWSSRVDLGQLSLAKEAIEESNILFKVDIVDYHRCSEQMIKNISKNIVKIKDRGQA